VALAGGIGAASGLAYYSFLVEIQRWSYFQISIFFLATGIIAWLAWRFVEPFFATVLLGHRLPSSQQERPVTWRRFAKTYLVVLTTAVFAEVLLHAVTTHGGTGLPLWFAEVLMFGAVTYSWTLGAGQRSPRAARTGGIAGAIIGGITLGVIGLFFGYGAVFPETRAYGASVEPSRGDMLGLAIGGAIAMGIRGFAGGKAIDVGGRIPVGFRVMLGVGAAVLIQGLLEQGLMYAFGVSCRFRWLQLFLQAIGWGVGLLMYPHSDFVLDAEYAN
jgi:hypothetical protein